MGSRAPFYQGLEFVELGAGVLGFGQDIGHIAVGEAAADLADGRQRLVEEIRIVAVDGVEQQLERVGGILVCLGDQFVQFFGGGGRIAVRLLLCCITNDVDAVLDLGQGLWTGVLEVEIAEDIAPCTECLDCQFLPFLGASTFIAVATSVTLRAIGPAVSISSVIGISRSRLITRTVSQAGRSPISVSAT